MIWPRADVTGKLESESLNPALEVGNNRVQGLVLNIPYGK